MVLGLQILPDSLVAHEEVFYLIQLEMEVSVFGTLSEPDRLRGLLGHFETLVIVKAQLYPEVCIFLVTPSDTLFIRTLFHYWVEQMPVLCKEKIILTVMC